MTYNHFPVNNSHSAHSLFWPTKAVIYSLSTAIYQDTEYTYVLSVKSSTWETSGTWFRLSSNLVITAFALFSENMQLVKYEH